MLAIGPLAPDFRHILFWATIISKIKHRTNTLPEPFDPPHHLTLLSSRKGPSEITRPIFLQTNTHSPLGITLGLEKLTGNNKNLLLQTSLENNMFQTARVLKAFWSGNFDPKEHSCRRYGP